MKLPWSAARLGLVAGLLGGGAGLAVVSGVTSAPTSVQLASAADDDPTTTSTTVEEDEGGDSAPTTETRVIDAAGAGTVTVTRDGNSLALASVDPASGWQVDVEQAAGQEIEVDFRNAAQRVQVDVELEDGVIRERVRVRDEVADTDTSRIDDDDDEVGLEPTDDERIDNSGPGSFTSGPTDDDERIDNSGPGSHNDADDDDADDDDADDDNSGPGSHDDDPDDDNSGSGSEDSHD